MASPSARPAPPDSALIPPSPEMVRAGSRAPRTLQLCKVSASTSRPGVASFGRPLYRSVGARIWRLARVLDPVRPSSPGVESRAP